MFLSSSLISITLLSLPSVLGNPIKYDTNGMTLAFTANLKPAGFATIPDADRARASYLRSASHGQENAKRDDVSFSVQNAGVTYTASIGVGFPATQYTLLIDTGSSNTWVKGEKYVATVTSQKTSDSVAVSYGSGSFSGTEYIDTVTLALNLIIDQQSIGVASNFTGFADDVDGILGVGPVDLTIGTLTSNKDAQIPTVTDNLAGTGRISSNALGIFYVPSSTSDNSGELTFGGPDTSKTTGNIQYVPITGTSPASQFWGIDQSIGYGGKSVLSSTAGIVDTGTTLILIATDSFNAYKSATGGVDDKATGLLKISAADFDNLQNLDFNIGKQTYSLTPNAQIWPRSLNTKIGGDAGGIYLIVADIGTASGSGLDFINGYAFLQRFYSVYDTTNRQVGFAPTEYTTATTN